MAIENAEEALAVDAAVVVDEGVGVLHSAAPALVSVLGYPNAEGRGLRELGSILTGGSHGQRAVAVAGSTYRRRAQRGAAAR